MNKKSLFMVPMIAVLLSGCVGTRHYGAFPYFTKHVEWKENQDFRILQLSDIHFSQSDYYNQHFEVMQKTIDEAQPDLIIVNGDAFTFATKSTVATLFTWLDTRTKEDGSSIAWSFTFGNHDDQGYYADTYIQRLLAGSTFNNVRFVNLEDDDVTGRSNFVINITRDNSVKYQVYLFDSHSYNFDKDMYYDYIKQDQVDWYKRMIAYTKQYYGNVKSSAFFHIPLPEFREELEKHNDDQEYLMGGNAEICSGPYYNSGLFQAIKEEGLTQSVSCAHDHVNDFVIRHEGVYLTYGVHATDRIYFINHQNEEDKSNWKIGGQLITLKEDGSFNETNITNIKVTNSYGEGR